MAEIVVPDSKLLARAVRAFMHTDTAATYAESSNTLTCERSSKPS